MDYRHKDKFGTNRDYWNCQLCGKHRRYFDHAKCSRQMQKDGAKFVKRAKPKTIKPSSVDYLVKTGDCEKWWT